MGGPRWVWELLPAQPLLRGAGPVCPGFTFAPPSLPPTPSAPMRPEGASVGRRSGLGSQQAPGGPGGQGKCWPRSLLIVCPPSGAPTPIPLGAWDPFPSPSLPSGAPVPSRLRFSSLLALPQVLPGCWCSSGPLRCPWSPTSSW